MSALLVPGIAFIPIALISLMALVQIISARRRGGSPGTEAIRRRAMWFTIASAAAGAGAVVALLAAPGLRYGLGEALAPLAAGIGMVAVILVHELTWPKPTGTIREASLRRRTALGTAPRWLLVVSAIGVAGLWVIDLAGLIATGGDGRSLSRVADDTVGTSTPFPGWFYAVPTLVLSVVALALTAATLSVIATRTGFRDEADDAALRRLSGHRALRGLAFGHLITLAGHLLITGSAIGSVYESGWVHAAGAVLSLLAIPVVLAAFVALLLPSRALVRPAAGPAPEAGAPA